MNLAAALGEVARYQTLLSAATAILLAVIGYLRARSESRKRYTFDVLMRYTENTDVLKAMHHVRRHILESRRVEPQRIDAALEEHLALLLAYFQSIALAANSGMLDRNILVRARYGSMRALWSFFRPYIEEQRAQLGRRLLYVDLEDFLARNEGRYARYERAHGRRPGRAPATPAEA